MCILIPSEIFSLIFLTVCLLACHQTLDCCCSQLRLDRHLHPQTDRSTESCPQRMPSDIVKSWTLKVYISFSQTLNKDDCPLLGAQNFNLDLNIQNWAVFIICVCIYIYIRVKNTYNEILPLNYHYRLEFCYYGTLHNPHLNLLIELTHSTSKSITQLRN